MAKKEELDPSLIEAQYHCRELQAQALFQKAVNDSKVKLEDPDESSRLLALALATPPFLLETAIKETGIDEKELLNRITPSATESAKLGKTLHILKMLFHACAADNNRLTEVAIDTVDNRLPKALQVIFINNLQALRDISEDGSEQAALNVLNHVQGSTLLIRYRKDLVGNKINLKPAMNDGEVGSLPTVLPNVDVRYYYPKDQQNPTLSLVVNPF